MGEPLLENLGEALFTGEAQQNWWENASEWLKNLSEWHYFGIVGGFLAAVGLITW
jgi:hypothetical protein